MSGLTNLDDLVKAWGWTNYRKTANGKQLEFKYARLDVVWDKVRIRSTNTEFQTNKHQQIPQPQIVMQSKFTNMTGQSQEHTFRTERQTVSTCKTEIKKGFTKGYNLDLTLAVPYDVLQGTVGFGKEITMENSDEDTIERSVTWSVDSTVKAAPHGETTASLAVTVEEYSANFSTNVKLTGKVLVNIFDLRENRLVMTVETDIATLLLDVRRQDAAAIPRDVVIEQQKVNWPVAGVVNFNYGVSQNIIVQ